VVAVDDVHLLQLLARLAVVAKGEVVAGLAQRHGRRADHVGILACRIRLAQREYRHLVTERLQLGLVQRDHARDAVDHRFVAGRDHADLHAV
jgi:hypothetical protein